MALITSDCGVGRAGPAPRHQRHLPDHAGRAVNSLLSSVAQCSLRLHDDPSQSFYFRTSLLRRGPATHTHPQHLWKQPKPSLGPRAEPERFILSALLPAAAARLTAAAAALDRAGQPLLQVGYVSHRQLVLGLVPAGIGCAHSPSAHAAKRQEFGATRRWVDGGRVSYGILSTANEASAATSA